jgi:hypothetical protein
VAAKRVAIPAADPVELGAIGREQACEIAVERRRLQEARLELGERRSERVCEAGEACRAAEAVQRGAADDAADDERPLGVAEHRPRRATLCDAGEDVVERPDRAAEQCAAARQQVTLDAFDVRPVRDDEDRLPRKHSEITLQQERDLARVGRPGDEAETHRSILGLGPDGP